ncbi:TRAP transporter small permease [Tianweitania sp. BSSL-BM11]|uniref:TRAP transporter small permease protein n=1 Tax=Tianweitania aestuarii TaxID=2814886 RepID=A0ABS5RVS7_9HYPH|nr:TRAP transporter small permease [Tianweitania aestuarii]MBS9721163.1 TRAP transporter small permease [Tianweitania aestuarii]
MSVGEERFVSPHAIDPPGARALGALATVLRIVATCLLALMTCLIIAQVVGRNLLNSGMPWADELARFCGVALVFLCAPLLALRGQHVAVDMIPSMLPPTPRRIVAILVEAMVLTLSGFFLWGFYAFLGRAWKFATPTLGIPNWIYYAPSVICFLLLAAITLYRMLVLVRGGTLNQAEAVLP